MSRKSCRIRGEEQGFTLPEVLITIAIIGILSAIAIPSWQGIVKGRQADTATNQFASDLRLANTRALNQLTDWRVVYTVGQRDYKLVKLQTPYKSSDVSPPVVAQVINRSLPEGTKVISSTNGVDPSSVGTVSPSVVGITTTIEFNSDGTARGLTGFSGTIKIGSDDGSLGHDITFVAATSRIKIVS